jgi:cytochrome c
MSFFDVLRVLLCSLSICVFAALAVAGTAEDPQVAFNNSCRTCHSAKEGDHRLGPSLAGVVGRKAGSVPGYKFSSSMQSANIVWDEKTLDAFITNPEQVVNGNAMKPFGGVDSPEQRSQIIAYLKSISGK